MIKYTLKLICSEGELTIFRDTEDFLSILEFVNIYKGSNVHFKLTGKKVI